MFATGYIQDLPDSRDLSVEQAPVAIFGSSPPPERYDELAKRFDIHLEQSAESCVGYSCAEAFYGSWSAQGIAKPLVPSPSFIWWNARKTHGMQTINSGTYLRAAFRQMARLGICPNEVWPGTDGRDLWNFNVTPSRRAFMKAYDQKLTHFEYYRINGLGDERESSWKRALYNDHPVVFGLPIDQRFADYDGEGYIESPGASTVFTGGHAMCALGYDQQGVYGPQSWSKGWGRDGWFHITWKYIRQFAMDQWALRVPQYYSEVP